MEKEFGTMSGWFALKAGFKAYARCPECDSLNVSYHKVRRPGL